MRSVLLAGVIGAFCGFAARDKLDGLGFTGLDFGSGSGLVSHLDAYSINPTAWGLLVAVDIEGAGAGHQDLQFSEMQISSYPNASSLSPFAVKSDDAASAREMTDSKEHLSIPVISVSQGISQAASKLSSWAVDAAPSTPPTPSPHTECTCRDDTPIQVMCVASRVAKMILPGQTVMAAMAAVVAAAWSWSSGTWTGVRCCLLLLLVFMQSRGGPDIYLGV